MKIAQYKTPININSMNTYNNKYVIKHSTKNTNKTTKQQSVKKGGGNT